MKKATDRNLLDKELKALNRRLKTLSKTHHQYATVPGFMRVIDFEIQKRLKKNASS